MVEPADQILYGEVQMPHEPAPSLPWPMTRERLEADLAARSGIFAFVAQECIGGAYRESDPGSKVSIEMSGTSDDWRLLIESGGKVRRMKWSAVIELLLENREAAELYPTAFKRFADSGDTVG